MVISSIVVTQSGMLPRDWSTVCTQILSEELGRAEQETRNRQRRHEKTHNCGGQNRRLEIDPDGMRAAGRIVLQLSGNREAKESGCF